jgi:hypothetical protein
MFKLGFLAAWLQVMCCSSGVMTVLGSQQSMLRRLVGDSDDSDAAPLVCHVAIILTSFEKSAEQQKFVCIPIDQDGEESDDMFDLQLPPGSILDGHEETLEQGLLHLRISGASVVEEHVVLGPHSHITVVDPPQGKRNLAISNVVGPKTILVVRVSTIDAEPTTTANELEVGLFGDSINLRTQYDACSFGKLQLELAHGGAIDILVNTSISEFTEPDPLVSAAKKVLEQQYNVDKASSLADKIMFCLPPGTGDWVAFAMISSRHEPHTRTTKML